MLCYLKELARLDHLGALGMLYCAFIPAASGGACLPAGRYSARAVIKNPSVYITLYLAYAHSATAMRKRNGLRRYKRQVCIPWQSAAGVSRRMNASPESRRRLDTGYNRFARPQEEQNSPSSLVADYRPRTARSGNPHFAAMREV